MGVAALRLFTVTDYHQMVAAGVLAPDEQVELIEGQLFQMAAKGTAHSAAVTRIDRILSAQLTGRALLRLQDPVQLSDWSEPEPDIAIIQLDPSDYEDHHPQPAEIFWLIEVADASLKRDLELKAPLYARSGIREYWVLDVQERCLYGFQPPGPAGYAARVLCESETIAPLACPDGVISVSEFPRPLS
jgi:Uma2 family endonuclease